MRPFIPCRFFFVAGCGAGLRVWARTAPKMFPCLGNVTFDGNVGRYASIFFPDSARQRRPQGSALIKGENSIRARRSRSGGGPMVIRIEGFDGNRIIPSFSASWYQGTDQARSARQNASKL